MLRMTTPILEAVLKQLDETKGQHKIIAQKSGVEYSTLRKIAGRFTKNPRFDKVQKLHDYFQNVHYKRPDEAA